MRRESLLHQADLSERQANQAASAALDEVGHFFGNGTEMALKNESLAGKVHPVTEVPFDKDGFPIFESQFEAKIGPEMYQAKDRAQFKEANLQLHEAIQKDPELKKKFTPAELSDIAKGRTPEDYTWHHHQEEGRLQLVEKEIHLRTGHTGGRAIWGGGSQNR